MTKSSGENKEKVCEDLRAPAVQDPPPPALLLLVRGASAEEAAWAAPAEPAPPETRQDEQLR